MEAYKVIRSESTVGLEKAVERYLENGWHLYGGLVVDEEAYMQVMVRGLPYD